MILLYRSGNFNPLTLNYVSSLAGRIKKDKKETCITCQMSQKSPKMYF